MQPYRLTVDEFLDHAAKWFGRHEIVERGDRVATLRQRALSRVRHRAPAADLRRRGELCAPRAELALECAYDFGYQWVTRIARVPQTGDIVGEGIRLGVFLLDASKRRFAEWLVGDTFYHPER